MNIDYSNEVMDLFHSPKHSYVNESFSVMGFGGDANIGEIIHLYFDVSKAPNYIDSKITRATFSAMGSVLLIAAAEKFCSLVEGLSFQDALKYCDPEIGLQHVLMAPPEKIHSVNFVSQAFYKALEVLTVS